MKTQTTHIPRIKYIRKSPAIEPKRAGSSFEGDWELRVFLFEEKRRARVLSCLSRGYNPRSFGSK